MLLSDELLCIISPEPTSYIEFSDVEAKTFFEETFQEKWDSAVKEVMDENYVLDKEEVKVFIENNPNPLSTFLTAKGFCAVFEDPYILDMWGSRAYPNESNAAIINTLETVKEKYPDIEYSGCIQYMWSDTHCRDVEKFEINCDRIHRFVAHALDVAAQDEFFWEAIMEEEDPEAIRDEMLLYKEFLAEDTIKKINEI